MNKLNLQLAQALGYTGINIPDFGPSFAIELFDKHGLDVRKYPNGSGRVIYYVTMENNHQYFIGEGEDLKSAIFKAFVVSRGILD